MNSPSKPRPSFLSFLKKNTLPVGVLLVSVIALLFFSSGFIANLIYFADPKHQNQPLEAWMTPKYVVMSYDLPPQIVDDVMGLRPKIDKQKPLTKVLEDLDMTMDELQIKVDAAQAEHQASLEMKKPKERKDPPQKKAADAKSEPKS